MNQTPVRIGVLAVQGDVREHIHVLTTLGVQAAPVRRPGELDDVDALVIPGGESTTMDKLVRAFELRGPLRKRLADGMPAYGSCAGMIMLADHLADARPDQLTLGGIDMTVRRNAFGRQVDSFEADLEIAQLRDGTSHPLRAIFIRAPWVEQVGPEVQVLARVASGGGDSASADGHDGQAPPRIVAVRQGDVLATSFHPEVSGDHRIHEYFIELVRAART